jgi:uncharacterized cofD-like protein
MTVARGPRVVVIGGGTGTFTVLSGLKNYARDLAAVVCMIDSGGSGGVLRDELGVLPPGDVRQALVALSDSSQDLRDLFNYRFPEGALKGHAFGNLFITALEKMTGSIGEAVHVAGDVLRVQGQVVPATTDDVHLMLKTSDGRVIKGEDQIGEGPASDRLFVKGEPHKLWLEPAAKLNPEAAKVIADADVIVVAPGKLYSSIMPSFLLKGMKEAITQAKGKKVFITNLMTRPNQTAGFTVTDFADEIERYVGAPFLDYVIFNTERPSKALLERYAVEGDDPVDYDLSVLDDQHYRAVGEPLVARMTFRQDPADKLKRSLIRHDSDKLARIIMRIYFS